MIRVNMLSFEVKNIQIYEKIKVIFEKYEKVF